MEQTPACGAEIRNNIPTILRFKCTVSRVQCHQVTKEFDVFNTEMERSFSENNKQPFCPALKAAHKSTLNM